MVQNQAIPVIQFDIRPPILLEDTFSDFNFSDLFSVIKSIKLINLYLFSRNRALTLNDCFLFITIKCALCRIHQRDKKHINLFLGCWFIAGQCPWLKDCPQKFTVALEANCLFFGQSFSLGHYPPIYQPAKGVYLLSILHSMASSCLHAKQGLSCLDQIAHLVRRD